MRNRKEELNAEVESLVGTSAEKCSHTGWSSLVREPCTGLYIAQRGSSYFEQLPGTGEVEATQMKIKVYFRSPSTKNHAQVWWSLHKGVGSWGRWPAT